MRLDKHWLVAILLLLGSCAGSWDPRRTCTPPYTGPIEGESFARYFGNGEGYDLLMRVSEASETPSIELTFNDWGRKATGWRKPISGWWCRGDSVAHLRNELTGREMLVLLEAMEGGRLRLIRRGDDVVILRRLHD